jgi:hypothetical protein
MGGPRLNREEVTPRREPVKVPETVPHKPPRPAPPAPAPRREPAKVPEPVKR